MKKLIYIFVFIFILIGLVGCKNTNKPEPTEQEIKEQRVLKTFDENELIVYSNGDNKDSVSNNLTLVDNIEGYIIYWSSSNSKVIKNDGTVIKGDENVKVTLTATILISDTVNKTRTFEITVSKQIKHNVIIVKDNNEEDLLVVVNSGDKIDLSFVTTPIKEGYKFLGWFNGEEEFDFNTPIISDTVITAKWEKIPVYKVQFDINWTEGENPDQQLILENKLATKPNVLDRVDYKFMGWFLDLESEEPFNFNTPITNDLLLYAKWRQKELYTVTFHLNGGDGETPTPQSVHEGGLVTKPTDPTKPDSPFGGWALEIDNPIRFKFSTPIMSNIDLYAIWIEIEQGEGYYEDITAYSGEAMANQLKDLITVTNVSYGEVRYILEESDLNQDGSNKLWGMYDGKPVDPKWDEGATWDREHVWPSSFLGVGKPKNSTRNQASDPHNLRAIVPSVNRARSNRYFVDGSGLNRTIGTDQYYPGDDHKGDVARILLYMAVRYKDILTLVEHPSGTNYEPSGANMGQLSVLLKWHQEDPVDAFEINRNQVIFEHQGNRNPFIDYETWFEPVWRYFMGQQNLTIQNVQIMMNTLNTYIENRTNYVDLNIRYEL